LDTTSLFSSMGIPKYFMGRVAMGQVNISLYCWLLSLAAPRQKISLLWKLKFKPRDLLKQKKDEFHISSIFQGILHEQNNVICLLENCNPFINQMRHQTLD
jgi:hypothetical protein